jgi:hypothetical protein
VPRNLYKPRRPTLDTLIVMSLHHTVAITTRPNGASKQDDLQERCHTETSSFFVGEQDAVARSRIRTSMNMTYKDWKVQATAHKRGIVMKRLPQDTMIRNPGPYHLDAASDATIVGTSPILTSGNTCWNRFWTRGTSVGSQTVTTKLGGEDDDVSILDTLEGGCHIAPTEVTNNDTLSHYPHHVDDVQDVIDGSTQRFACLSRR